MRVADFESGACVFESLYLCCFCFFCNYKNAEHDVQGCAAALCVHNWVVKASLGLLHTVMQA